jgi:hypothetical protein
MKRRMMLRMVGETLDQMRSVARRWPEATVITSFPRSVSNVRSRAEMKLYVDVDRRDILEELESAEVSENHLKLITYELRIAWYERIGHLSEVDRHWLQAQVRGTLHQLLRFGDWIDEPENLGLKKLNSRLEKFDLGRRSDLKFSSQQSWTGKYDYDRKRTDLQPEAEEAAPDWKVMYRDGTSDVRATILEERPWLKSSLIEEYGEP